MIKVRNFEEGMLGDVVSLYNWLTHNTPYCYPLTDELFVEAVTGKDEFDPAGFLVAMDGDKPMGFLHAGFADRDAKTGGIYLFLADAREACHALLGAALDHFRELDVNVCYSASNLSGSERFYSGVHLGCEVGQWQGFYQVSAAFRHFGFDLVRERFVMAADLPGRPPDRGFDGIDFQVVREPDTGSFHTNAKVVGLLDGKEAGNCPFYMLTQVSAHLGFGIGQVRISVAPEFQGKGLGAALVNAVHQQLFDMGVRRSILTTNYQLYRAIRFWSKMGYVKQEINLPVFAKHLGDE